MALSMRKILLAELGIEETERLTAISKLVRANSKMDKNEKKCCMICKAPSKCVSNDKDATNIYNHHVMKVEYISILVDKFGLYKNREIPNKNEVKTDEYHYIDGFKPFCPRVAVCHDNHTMFHELGGDNPLDLVKDIKLEEAENILNVFEELYIGVLENCQLEENDALKEYKEMYLKVWNETMIKSLARLGYVSKLSELKSIAKKDTSIDEKEMFKRYEKLETRIEEIIDTTTQLDDRLQVKLPELHIFTIHELEDMENEFIKVGKEIDAQNLKTENDEINSYNYDEDFYYQDEA